MSLSANANVTFMHDAEGNTASKADDKLHLALQRVAQMTNSKKLRSAGLPDGRQGYLDTVYHKL